MIVFHLIPCENQAGSPRESTAPKLRDLLELIGAELQVGGGSIFPYLMAVTASRNDDADGRMPQAKGDGRLGERSPWLFQKPQTFHFFELFLENLSGEVAGTN